MKAWLAGYFKEAWVKVAFVQKHFDNKLTLKSIVRPRELVRFDLLTWHVFL